MYLYYSNDYDACESFRVTFASALVVYFPVKPTNIVIVAFIYIYS